ncbi:MAG TPA: hypothetical protein VMC08_01385 [Bacteroidales bacterium]|nr:hypothetical protein [Bacteroidales bacterium]
MSRAEALFLKIGKEVPGVKEGKMFGSLCLKTPGGKAAAMLWKDDLVVKLPKQELEKALLLQGAKFFEPMDNRPMKEWVQIPAAHSVEWARLIRDSVAYVNSLK